MKNSKLLALLIVVATIISCIVFHRIVIVSDTMPPGDTDVFESTPSNILTDSVLHEMPTNTASAEGRNENSYHDVSVNGLLAYLKQKSNRSIEYSKIDINQMYIQEETLYFATIQQDFFWETELYLIQTQNGMISDVVPSGAAGLDATFDYELIDISQGRFLAAYCASHSGNGNLELIPLDNLGRAQYSIPAVDSYYEDTKETATEYGLAQNENDDVTASAVYLNGKLHASYTDVDGDGHTDIILSGVQQIFVEEANEQELTLLYFVENFFLFDSSTDTFVFSEELSEKNSIMRK